MERFSHLFIIGFTLFGITAAAGDTFPDNVDFESAGGRGKVTEPGTKDDPAAKVAVEELLNDKAPKTVVSGNLSSEGDAKQILENLPKPWSDIPDCPLLGERDRSHANSDDPFCEKPQAGGPNEPTTKTENELYDKYPAQRLETTMGFSLSRPPAKPEITRICQGTAADKEGKLKVGDRIIRATDDNLRMGSGYDLNENQVNRQIEIGLRDVAFLGDGPTHLIIEREGKKCHVAMTAAHRRKPDSEKTSPGSETAKPEIKPEQKMDQKVTQLK